ncbi:MAG: dihydroorotase [Caulobacteraceae bacterium]
MSAARPTAYVNARLLDPESGYDGPGSLVVAEGVIAGVEHAPRIDNASPDLAIHDCGGALLIPGLVDLRVKTGEPGSEPKETLKSASLAAAAGGVTTIVVQPDTDPVVDEPAVVDFILRRARDIELVHVLAAGAATRGLEGKRMAELGLMTEAGAVYFTDTERPIVDSKVFRRVLSYARAFGRPVAHRPLEPYLSAGAVATEGELAGRLGLSSVPAVAERIMLERDLALAELTQARLIVDQITTEGALDSLRRALNRGVKATATASINHLCFNEVDIGDYRTFCRLDPPLRAESDRQALIAALADGSVKVVTSAHTPAPAEDKRLPFSEATPGAIGLETLLPALLSLHHEQGLDLATLVRTVTLAPAELLGLPCGRLKSGAPADLVLCDLDAPRLVDADKLRSKSKNTPFDGRRLQGETLLTVVDGRIVYERDA